MSAPLIIDAVALLLILIAGISGLVKGAVKVVGAIAGLAAAIFIAWRLAPVVATLLFSRMEPAVLARILAFAIVFIAVMALAALLVFLATKLIDAILLGWLNKLLGFVIGLVFGIIIVAALAWLSVQIFPPLQEIYSRTFLVRLLVGLVSIVVGATPAAPAVPAAAPPSPA